MRMQAQLAIDKADVIIFVTDVTSGVTANDADVADAALHQDKSEQIWILQEALSFLDRM